MGMNLRSQYPGYLRKEDVEKPTLLTIASIDLENMTDGASKVVCFFEETDRGWVVNKTNANIMMDLFGTDTDDMIGQKLVLYAEPNIMFAGKRVGGIMCRAPKQAKPTQNRKQKDPDAAEKAAFENAMNNSTEADDDDIPF